MFGRKKKKNIVEEINLVTNDVTGMDDVNSSFVPLENPLPGPKKHVKKTLDFDRDFDDGDDFEHYNEI